MRVAVLGAGVAGLVCAYRLAEAGHGVDVYERWPGLGGQAATFDAGGGVRLERYYHYLFTSDTAMVGLFRELGLDGDLEPHESNSALLVDGRSWPFNGGLDLLRFGPIPLGTRLRMGASLVRLQLLERDLHRYEHVTAREWITRNMGAPAWDVLWGPLMRGKFGARASDISAAWIWDKVCRRRNIRKGEARQEVFLYPRRSFEPLFAELRRRIEELGGRVAIDRPAARLERASDGRLAVVAAEAGSFRQGLDPRDFPPDGPAEAYDAVAACVPNHVFCDLLDERLVAEVGEEYLGRLRSIEYFTALNLLVELDRPLTSSFWLNVADRAVPFVGVVEHTNFVGAARYGGRHFAHLTNYLEPGHALAALDADELLAAYLPGLRIVNPGFEPGWIRQRWRFLEPAAQPIVDVGYEQRIPPRRTPAEGLMLVNTTQIYPEDRGTNYAVRDGERCAEEIAALGPPGHAQRRLSSPSRLSPAAARRRGG